MGAQAQDSDTSSDVAAHADDEAAARERAWIAQARTGDTEAFGHLVEQYSNRILTHLFRLTGNRHDAEDLTQETFLRAFRFLSRYDSSRPFRNWLYTVATNVGLNALRADRRRGIPTDAGRDAAHRPELVDVGENGRQRVARTELEGRLAEAVSRLSPRSAMLIHLRYREGMSVREAADIVGLSEGAAKVVLCRARRALREWLVEDAPHGL